MYAASSVKYFFSEPRLTKTCLKVIAGVLPKKKNFLSKSRLTAFARLSAHAALITDKQTKPSNR